MSTKTLALRGVIVDDWYDNDWFAEDIESGAITPAGRILRAIDAARESGDDILLRIDSPGGILDEANRIQQALDALPDGRVRIELGALVASAAANIVALTRHPVAAHRTTRLMYHSATSLADGSPDAHRDTAEQLDAANAPVRAALVAAGIPAATVDRALREGMALWLSAAEALGYGLVDEIIDADAPAAPAPSPAALARLSNPSPTLARLSERMPLLREVARLAALSIPAPEAPAADPAPAAAGESAPAPDSAPAEDPPPAPEPAPEPEPAPAPEPAPTAELADTLSALRAALADREHALRAVQSAAAKRTAELRSRAEQAERERDELRAQLRTLTDQARDLRALAERERALRASIVGGVLAPPETEPELAAAAPSATPHIDAYNALATDAERSAYYRAHLAEIQAERPLLRRRG